MQEFIDKLYTIPAKMYFNFIVAYYQFNIIVSCEGMKKLYSLIVLIRFFMNSC